MTDATTPNKGYTLPTPGADEGTWGTILNANWGILDANLGSQYAISATGGTVTLTPTEASNLFLNVNGALVSALTIVLPINPGFFLAYNQTSGGQSVILAAAGGGTTVTAPQGGWGLYYSDGTTVFTAARPTSIIYSVSVASGSAIAFSSGGVASVLAIDLLPGIWDVWGSVAFNVTGTMTSAIASISPIYGTQPSVISGALTSIPGIAAASGPTLPVGRTRFTINALTPIYLLGSGTFTGTCAAFGVIFAEQVG